MTARTQLEAQHLIEVTDNVVTRADLAVELFTSLQRLVGFDSRPWFVWKTASTISINQPPQLNVALERAEIYLAETLPQQTLGPCCPLPMPRSSTS